MKIQPTTIKDFAMDSCLRKYIARSIDSEIYARTNQYGHKLGIDPEKLADRILEEIDEYTEHSPLTIMKVLSND